MLPQSDMNINLSRVALVVIDPQVDFLSPNGVLWELIGPSVTKNNTVENLQKLFIAAKKSNIVVAISPHYYFPHDNSWKFGGAIEKVMHDIQMFQRTCPYQEGVVEHSGADFMDEYKEYILDGKTIITSPHKVYGPQQNDLTLQLRKNHIEQIILAGMSANLCVESHLRDLLEQGFEVAVVRDATAAAHLAEGDGYQAALTNFSFMANAVWSTDETIALLEKAAE